MLDGVVAIGPGLGSRDEVAQAFTATGIRARQGRAGDACEQTGPLAPRKEAGAGTAALALARLDEGLGLPEQRPVRPLYQWNALRRDRAGEEQGDKQAAREGHSDRGN
ncbi:hypothetical protein GCM10011324_21870 [Allosediminivita pacifica]|nr:hypothetical protein GCM10011324_21870 [Allosediminivita pacifica]